MGYWCHFNPCRRSADALFNQKLRVKWIPTFPCRIASKMNLKARLQLQFTNNVVVHHIIHYVSSAPFRLDKNMKTIHHHHHVVPPARITLTLSNHFSLSFIASGRSSGLDSVSSHSYSMYIRAGFPAFPRPYVVVHRSTSRMSSSLLLQQRPACLVRLTWIVFVMEGRWHYSWCLKLYDFV